MVTPEQIKELREQTGISVMQCKKALEEAGGDKEKALAILKEKSAEQAAKKADRELGAGVVQSYIHSNGMMGSLVQLASETDFVSNNAEFRTIASDIAMHVTAMNPAYLKAEEAVAAGASEEEALLSQPFVKNPSITIQGLIDAAMQKFGEKVELVRFTRFEIGK